MVQKRKRRESWGAVRTLPSGRIQASYTGPDGKRYTAPLTFTATGDARGWLAVQRAAIVAGDWSEHDASTSAGAKQQKTGTLGEYASDWLETRVSRNGEALKPRTRAEYQRLLLGPLGSLTDSRLAALSPAKIRTWYSALLATGKKTQAARAYGLLNAIMGTAVQDGRVKVNPCMVRGAQSATSGRDIQPPTSAELEKIVTTITPRFKAAVIIAAWGGLRYGELTELRRKDIVITREGNTVTRVAVAVTRAVTHTTGHGYIVGSPKSRAGVRVVELPPHVFDDVLEHLRKHTGDFPDSLLFPAAAAGTHLAESTFVKHWYPARDAAGRSDLPFHALRHYGATRYALTGATLKEIQERMGHSTVKAAMTYQHAAGRDAELARRMSDLA